MEMGGAHFLAPREGLMANELTPFCVRGALCVLASLLLAGVLSCAGVLYEYQLLGECTACSAGTFTVSNAADEIDSAFTLLLIPGG